MPSISRKKLAGKKTKLARPAEKTAEHPAALDDYQEGSFYKIPTDIIKPNPYQPRQYFDKDSLIELSDSIEQKGVLQPILVRRDEQGQISMVAGERRLRAARTAGLAEIPAIFTKGHPAEIALIENLQRDNLKPMEEAEALARMVDEYSYTQEQLAKVIGKARTTITETLSLNKLPEEIKDQCRRADIYPRRLLVEIAKQKTPKDMTVLFQTVQEGKLKSDQVRKISRAPAERKRRTMATILLERTVYLRDSLDSLDLNTVEETEKVQLLTQLKDLKDLIEKLLA